ncbi:hypothetical protein LIER_17920 [Lithospermum erythrorhizon]|uniref:Protein-serine/threonine phosphatase n=1 Tax=Lithospermum erythrorhizon TaxID=34254 RepID=A0AAV3QEW2_LITER
MLVERISMPRLTTVELVNDDTMVMGTDGLFDNVFYSEIVSTLAAYQSVADAAKALAGLDRNHSKDLGFGSPHTH